MPKRKSSRTSPPPSQVRPGLTISAAAPSSGRWGRRECVIAAFLVAITLLTFAPVLQSGFVNYDDGEYVYENPHVRTGLSRDNLAWGLKYMSFGMWHPLSYWSLMLDAQLYGLNAWGFHLTNLLWHTGSVVVLFAALRRLTGQPWPSALAAAVFAVHPLNVESVTWISERKGVISAFFWMLTLWAYARYVQKPGILQYLLVGLCLLLGLMAKPVLVTLPFVLVLLDFWPLRRVRGLASTEDATETAKGRFSAGGTLPPASVRRLLAEKVPLLAVALLFSLVAMIAEKRGETLSDLDELPVSARVGNAVISYTQYLRQAMCPTGLAAFYPHPGANVSAVAVGAAAALLLGITLLVCLLGRRAPYLPFGWCWYLGTLAPVSGLVQVGAHGRADRYVYVPLVGIIIALAWGLTDVARRWQMPRLLAYVGLPALLCLGLVSWTQVHYWHDSITLWEHALLVTDRNWLAHDNLGAALVKEGRAEEAIPHFQEALAIHPGDAHYNWGTALLAQGKVAEAVTHFEEVLRTDPNHAKAHNNLGSALARLGRSAEAVTHFEAAVRLSPDPARAEWNLGRALLQQGEWQRAAASFRRAVALQPADARSHRCLAYAYHASGEPQLARAEYDESLRLDPHWPQAAARSAWALATRPDPLPGEIAGGLQEAEQAYQAVGDRDPQILDALAAAYASSGSFERAETTARKAQALAAAGGQPQLVEEIEGRLRLYEKRQRYHATTP